MPDVSDSLDVVVAGSCHRGCMAVERQATIEHQAHNLHLIRYRQINTGDGYGRHVGRGDLQLTGCHIKTHCHNFC